MKQRNIACTVVLAVFAVTAILANTSAAEPPPLTKDQAAKLLKSMGYEEVVVGAIVQGPAPASGSQSDATVLAIARRQGKTAKVETQMFYDAELGWFHYEYDDPVTKLSLWTLSGYNELKPKYSITDAAATEQLVGAWKPQRLNDILTFTKDGRWTQTEAGKLRTGTWKCENGIIVALEGESIRRFPILSLNQTTLVLQDKLADGTEVPWRLSRVGGN